MIKNMLLFTLILHLFINTNDAYGGELTFQKGQMSSVIQGKTIKGEQAYHFRAIQGQETSLTFLSLDESSSFSLYIKNHSQWIQIATNEKHWNGYLPTSQGNLYKVIVKGTKVDAPFELFVGVKPRDKAPQMIGYREGTVHLSMEKKQKK